MKDLSDLKKFLEREPTKTEEQIFYMFKNDSKYSFIKDEKGFLKAILNQK